MGLRAYWLWIIAAQFVLQSFVLILLMAAFARRRGDFRVRPIVLRVLAISLATVFIESWMTWRLGWVVLVPLLGVTVLVLMNASWESLWSSCIAVALCGGFFAGLTLEYSEFTPERLREIRLEREIRKARATARYQQLANQIDRVAPQPKAVPATPARPERVTSVTNEAVAARAGEALHLEARIALEDRLAAQGIETPREDPVQKNREDQQWRIARSLINYRGRVGSEDGIQILHINGKLYKRNDMLKVICGGTVYHWLVLGGDLTALELKRIEARSLP